MEPRGCQVEVRRAGGQKRKVETSAREGWAPAQERLASQFLDIHSSLLQPIHRPPSTQRDIDPNDLPLRAARKWPSTPSFAPPAAAPSQGEGGWTADRGGAQVCSTRPIRPLISPERPNRAAGGACRAIVGLLQSTPELLASRQAPRRRVPMPSRRLQEPPCR
ncbi:uncharacterized protein CC84DRAFT_1230976 [Paraphaeosphaeria sporulosa]|uniref:Uncharacterized protein n=1 Tax=Paraphaeosphaeria sporulosa TaxID=1460663 RepID=A0A177BZQ1_9PLEO|nr:uncharacterized protein CC84DRAFT_1230976 [Paraphaeosphaeria sporulosa]OAG00695.1 hypothetical protein CC84DRAFT_1230976 [Paraphaeosphaeria sporulosa]